MTKKSIKSTVIVMRGLSGSGKSTWARQKVEDHGGMYKRFTRDMLREMVDNSHWSKSNEKFIIKLRDLFILEALKEGYNVIVDDTNLGKHFDQIKVLVGDLADVELQDFTHVPLQQCIEQDLKRLHSVGKDVIMKQYNQYLNPNKARVYDGLPPPKDPDLSDAGICDLDGTISLLNGRSPYDASTCEQDIPNIPVIETLNGLRKNNPELVIFFTSGRSDKYIEPTKNFLKNNGFEINGINNILLMRKEGDFRKDSEIKQELYYINISGRYNVILVLDDRNQVVELWRSLGLTCFQVAPGDF